MGRWKNDGSGNPVWDANDSGPDQIQGMPAGGPQGQQAPSGAGSPWGGGGPINGGWGSEGPGGWTGHAQDPGWGKLGGQPTQQQPQGGQGSFNPPNAWAQPEEGETPGWGPIKISTHYQPGDGFPHPFENGFQVGDKGKMPIGVADKIGKMPIGFGGDGSGLWGGPGHPDPDDPNFQFPHQIPGDNQGPMAPFPGGGQPWLQQAPNGAGTPTPNPGEDYQGMFSRYLNDYHAPDRDNVISNIARNDPNPIYMHLMDQMNSSPNGMPSTGALNPVHKGGLAGFLGVNPLFQQLIARRNGGQ